MFSGMVKTITSMFDENNAPDLSEKEREILHARHSRSFRFFSEN